MKNKKINLYTYSVQFSIEEADYSQTYLAQMYPPVEASSCHEQYHIRLTWHFTECNWEGSLESDYPPVEASDGQEQY